MIETSILKHAPISDDDIAHVNDLLYELNPNLERFTREHINGLTESDENIIYVARYCGAIIGMVILVRSANAYSDRTGVIHKFVVEKAHRNKGVGVLLLSRVISIAKQSGVRELTLTAGIDRSEAIRIYESKQFGFINRGMLHEGYCKYHLALR